VRKKFTVRDFVFEENKSAKADKKKLQDDKERIRMNLIKWCKLNFSEVFIAWLHLKAIRTFVESVLRYGLPINFQAMLLLPNKGKQRNLRRSLGDLYKVLSNKSIYSKESDVEDIDLEKFYPYVSLDINVEFKVKPQ